MTRRGRIGRRSTFGCEAIKPAREADALTGDGSVKERRGVPRKPERQASQHTAACLPFCRASCERNNLDAQLAAEGR